MLFVVGLYKRTLVTGSVTASDSDKCHVDQWGDEACILVKVS